MIFQLSLTEEKVKRHQATALHLIVAFALMVVGAMLCLAYIFFKKAPMNKGEIVAQYMAQLLQGSWWGITAIIMGLALAFIAMFRSKWLQQPRVNKTFRIVELALVVGIGITALLWQFYVPAALFGVLALALCFALWWEGSSNTTTALQVEVSAEGIKLPVTSRRRFIRWAEVERVLLRHGTITIDCIDNRLFQWTVRPAGFSAADFENFCLARVNDAIPQRVKEW